MSSSSKFAKDKDSKKSSKGKDKDSKKRSSSSSTTSKESKNIQTIHREESNNTLQNNRQLIPRNHNDQLQKLPLLPRPSFPTQQLSQSFLDRARAAGRAQLFNLDGTPVRPLKPNDRPQENHGLTPDQRAWLDASAGWSPIPTSVAPNAPMIHSPGRAPYPAGHGKYLEGSAQYERDIRMAVRFGWPMSNYVPEKEAGGMQKQETVLPMVGEVVGGNVLVKRVITEKETTIKRVVRKGGHMKEKEGEASSSKKDGKDKGKDKEEKKTLKK